MNGPDATLASLRPNQHYTILRLSLSISTVPAPKQRATTTTRGHPVELSIHTISMSMHFSALTADTVLPSSAPQHQLDPAPRRRIDAPAESSDGGTTPYF